MKWLLGLLMAVSLSAHALDLSEQNGKDWGDHTKEGRIAIGDTTKKGFRFELDASTNQDDVGRLGFTFAVPLLKGDKTTVRVLGGFSGSILDNNESEYRLGIQVEYQMANHHSFIMEASNKYEPETRQWSARPVILTGYRYYF